MLHVGFYPGSFDPLTNGHLDVLKRALRLVDRLIVAVGVHHGKEPVFSVEERLEMIRAETEPFAREAGTELVTTTFSNLVIDAAREHGATIVVRGLRDGTDLDYEMQMAGMNGTLAPQIQTVLLPASPEARHVTATLVRQIAKMRGDVGPFVPPAVACKLAARFG